MNTNTSTAFIPKKPTVSHDMFGKKNTKTKGNKFQTFAVIIFFLAGISYGGLILYGNFISSSISDLELELVSAEERLDMENIDELLRFESKLTASQELLRNHVSVSSMFKMFEDSTVSTMQFTDFSMTALKQKPASLSLKGRAGSYSTIALQEKAFMDNKYTESASFSNFILNDEGFVLFSFEGTFNSSVVSFREMIVNLVIEEVVESESLPVDIEEIEEEDVILDSDNIN